MFNSARTTVVFSNVGHAYTHLFMLLYPTVVLTLEREFQRSYGELLTLATAGFVLMGAGALPAGWLADRWSGRGMMAIFFFGMGGAAVLTGLADSLFMIATGLGLIGLFASIYHPVGIALLVTNARSRGRTLGYNSVFGNFGAAVAALVAGALTDWISWRAAFIVPGLLAMATGVAFMLLSRGGDLGEETARQETAAKEMPRGTIVRALIVLSMTTLCAGLIYQITSVAMPKIVASRISDINAAGALGVGGLVTVVYLSASFAQIAGGYLADRFPLKPVFVLAYLVQVPLYFLAAILSGYPLLIAAVAVVSLSTGAAPVESVLYARFAPAKWRATVFGAKFAVSLGVAALGVPVVAMIYESTGGFFWLFVMLGCLAALLVAAAMFLPSVGGEQPVAGGASPTPATSPSQGD
jgi:MFS family permease